jgi:hypothetical protein
MTLAALTREGIGDEHCKAFEFGRELLKDAAHENCH